MKKTVIFAALLAVSGSLMAAPHQEPHRPHRHQAAPHHAKKPMPGKNARKARLEEQRRHKHRRMGEQPRPQPHGRNAPAKQHAAPGLHKNAEKPMPRPHDERPHEHP